MTSEHSTSTIAHSASVPAASNDSSAVAQQHHDANGNSANDLKKPRSLEPLEVGWQFVHEYYTFLNKDPNRLHCFYNKQSTMVHGVEGETVKTCFGQQDIHKRFKELGLQDAKVIISNVDSLRTINFGILVSVLGEIETVGQPVRAFSQCFILAEQTNGYFVLNDVFRYLKPFPAPSAVVISESQQVDSAPVAATPAQIDSVQKNAAVVAKDAVRPADVVPATVAVSSPSMSNKTTVPSVSEKPSTVAPKTVSEEQQQQPQPTKTQPPKEVTSVAPAKSAAPMPQQQQSQQSSSQQSDQQPAPTQPTVSSQKQPPKPQEPTATAPKSWAKLADADKERWAGHVSELKGQSVAVPPSPKISAKNNSNSNHNNNSNNNSGSANNNTGHHVHQEKSVGITGFTRATKITQIKEEFGRQGYNVRWVELVSDSSAHLEFTDPDQAKKAMQMKTIIINGETVTICDRKSVQPSKKSGGKSRGNQQPQSPNSAKK